MSDDKESINAFAEAASALSDVSSMVKSGHEILEAVDGLGQSIEVSNAKHIDTLTSAVDSSRKKVDSVGETLRTEVDRATSKIHAAQMEVMRARSEVDEAREEIGMVRREAERWQARIKQVDATTKDLKKRAKGLGVQHFFLMLISLVNLGLLLLLLLLKAV